MDEALKSRLVAQALAEGFSACRICRPWDVGHVAQDLAGYLEQGHHGTMGWLAERAHWRGAPDVLWPEARSVIMLSESYGPDYDPREDFDKTSAGLVSVYARNRDYHDLVKKRLKRVARWLIGEAGSETAVKVFVDTAPVPEKPLGQAAGLGWQGKHTNLVSREMGSWFFLSVRSLPPWVCRWMRRRSTIAGRAGPVLMPVRRMHFPRRIRSMRGAVFPI